MIVFEEVIAQRTGIPLRQVKNTVELLEEGATIPFFSRYRKEHTGSLDEVQIGDIRDALNQLKELQKRQEYILKIIDEQEKTEIKVKEFFHFKELYPFFLIPAILFLAADIIVRTTLLRTIP